MPHIHKEIDFTVVAYIVYQGKVLFIFHRKLQKWLPIGGHVELNEDPEEALLREVHEESGLEVAVDGKKSPVRIGGKKYLAPPEYLDIHPITPSHRHIGMIYFVRATSEAITLAKREHGDIRWFTEAELDDPQYNIEKDLQYYAVEAIKKFRK